MNNSYDHYELELYHHGIKGQKWGVRRTAEQLGHYVKRKLTRKTMDERIKAQEEKNRLTAAKVQAQENKNRLAEAKNAYKVARAKTARDVETAESEEALTRESRKRTVRDLKQDQRDRRDQLRKELTGNEGATNKSDSQKTDGRDEKSTSSALNNKTELIRSGNKQALQTYGGSLTNAEMREAIERIELNNRLSSIDSRRRQEVINKYSGYLNTTVNTAQNIIKGYNAFANVMNTFSSKEFKTIPGGGDGKKKKKKE